LISARALDDDDELLASWIFDDVQLNSEMELGTISLIVSA
jgi:hypothetical protein